MLQDHLGSESSTNSRIQQISDSHLIGEHVLTNKENSLAMPKLQEQEISLVLVHSSRLVIRLRRKYTDIPVHLLLNLNLELTMVLLLTLLQHHLIMEALMQLLLKERLIMVR